MPINFKDPSYLIDGNVRQKQAFMALQDLRVFELLAIFDPVLTGTIPIQIDNPTSDLDIICQFQDASQFEFQVHSNFGSTTGFSMHMTEKQGLPTVIARFQHKVFEIEIFGQPIPVTRQMAYRHMIKEYEILQARDDSFRLKVIQLKQQGLSTEAAFAKVLGIEGDPYYELLRYSLV